MTGALHLSGRAGAEKIRGTLHAGLEAPAAVRFEAIAPFGQPFFILAGRDNRASLLLPRDNRLLTDASVPALLERLTGLSLGAERPAPDSHRMPDRARRSRPTGDRGQAAGAP